MGFRYFAVMAMMAFVAGCGDSSSPTTESATVVTASAGSAADAPAAATINGQQIYERSCISCHGMGAAGAPKTGDKAAWEPHLAKGMDVLMASTLNGLPPGMPAKGLCVTCSEAELKAALDYMLAQSQ